MSFPVLEYFHAAEFHHPDQMDEVFLYWLDMVRAKAGSPFLITSDFRTATENAAASGSSPTSLHLLGRAVDFVLAQWSDEILWQVVRAVIWQSAVTPCGVELELVHGPRDRHIHLGLFPDARSSRLELNLT